MIPAIVIGRGGSKGFPNKNMIKVLGKELLRYPIEAAKKCSYIDKVYFSTDSIKLGNIAQRTGAEVIRRPPELATDEALGEDVFKHAYNYANQYTGKEIKYVALMFANAPCITSSMMEIMIEDWLYNSNTDSICTVSKYNMFSVNRARIEYKGLLINAVNSFGGNCDRNSTGDFWFYDCSCAIVKAEVLRNLDSMPPPQPWLGRSIKPYYQKIPALDLDYEYQLGQIEYWLKNARNE